MMSKKWKIWVDTGGTFTDCIAIDPYANTKRLKVLSSSVLRGRIIHQVSTDEIKVELAWPLAKDIFNGFDISIYGKKIIKRKIKSVDFKNSIITLSKPITCEVEFNSIEITSNEEVPVLAARLITGTSLSESFPPIEMRLGSTRGTNAILERKGARTAFITTKGFKDLLLIGNQQRPDLFALNVKKLKPLYDFVIEANERIESNGDVLVPISEDEVNRLIVKLKKQKIDSIAIAFLNSYKNPSHEIFIKDILERNGFPYVSVSHALSSQIKILPRAETTVANAYLAPTIHTYLNKIQGALRHSDLKIMSSAGGLIDINNFYPKESLLSGPAGGVVGAATAAKLSGVNQLITFDMGGTSTDVSLYNKRYDYRYESRVGEIKILSPSLAIDTIAAGGGSVCDFDGYRLMVGPESAGASPGPACYGTGGPLTITDVNLLLGRIDPDFFSMPLQLGKAREALDDLLSRVEKATKRKHKAEELLESFIQIANEKMGEAVKKISVQYGHNPSDFALLSFGGAGGQHACALASMLNVKRILIPYDAGLLSAYGIGHSRIEHFEEQLILSSFSEIENELPALIEALSKKAASKLEKEGYASSKIIHDKSFIFLRFRGQESTIEIAYAKEKDLVKEFRQKYKSIFGHWLSDREIEIESLKIVLYIPGHAPVKNDRKVKRYVPISLKSKKIYSGNKWFKNSFYRWENLDRGASIYGPAIITSHNSTTVVDNGWLFYLDKNNNGIITQSKKIVEKERHSDEARLELFSNRFTSIAEDMGVVLQRTSFSVNVKERLDFSCAVLDSKGYLVVNAPHIPVHLGSLGVCLREVIKVIDLREGDVAITNHPAYGGSHLPDVTLIKPVFFKKELVGYVANRAHHAEIGGKKPGSMPADATSLEEEGVIISPTWLVKRDKAQWADIKEIFTSAKYPTRSLEENLADLNGALASVNVGEKDLVTLCEKYGIESVNNYMRKLISNSSKILSEKIKATLNKNFTAEEKLDDGSILKVKITLHGKRISIDFTGTSNVHPGNLNATYAIVQSVVLYVLRLWVDKPIGMNEGLMEHVKLVLPICLLNPDFKNSEILPAVVGGNTEVSQRLTDTLLKALGLAACSQGTMNNFLFGNNRFGYYETICGGTGAGNGFKGADAVHSHMTNTRITDPEILELRYPVRLEKFEIRKDSGGHGKWDGGDGITREFLFKENLDVSILSQHRIQHPYGMKGGLPGKVGEQFLIDQSGLKKRLKGMQNVSVKENETIIIKTPGGGAWEK